MKQALFYTLASMLNKKEQRYDRQLRLWQAHGQAALESAKVCLINGTATGTETLKNLVLPGIGSFTVVDGNNVEPKDLGNNFFVTVDSLGQGRAKTVTALLREMNEDVEGNHVEEDPSVLLSSNPDFFQQFTLVIANDLPEKDLLSLGRLLWTAQIPLVVIKSYGFIGYLRLVVPEHTITEPHPDGIVDLRLDCPFPKLIEYANSFDLDNMDSMNHSHVPFPIILLKCLDEWKSHHGGNLPSTSQERNEFKELIRSKEKTPDEENFNEALAAAYRAWKKTEVPHDVKNILQDPATNLTSKSSSFWIIAKAISDFVAKHGQLPVPGVVPDMKSDTEKYVALQTIFRQKAREDVAEVNNTVQTHLHKLQLPENTVSQEEIERFCKHAAFVKVLRLVSLDDEPTRIKPWLTQELKDPDNLAISYLLLRSVDNFYEIHKRYPGILNEDVEEDIGLLKKSVHHVLASFELPLDSIPDDSIHEMVRAGASELHNIAAIMGGMASQEIIKLITHQYVPVKSSLIFDGVQSRSVAFL